MVPVSSEAAWSEAFVNKRLWHDGEVPLGFAVGDRSRVPGRSDVSTNNEKCHAVELKNRLYKCESCSKMS